MSIAFPPRSTFLTAAEAAATLEISVPTLYAYVSRGLLASEAVPNASRLRRYRREDVERLRARRELRRRPQDAAPRAIAWGEPVLESAITLLDGERLFYRGHDAVALSRQCSLEEVAALLWTGEPGAAATLFPPPAGAEASPAALAALHGVALSPVERLQVAVPLAGAADAAAWDLRPAAVARCGARILRLAAATVAGQPMQPGGVAATLAAAWRPRGRDAHRALSAALVLAADHELNASTFAARCAASAQATPWDAVSAGLATLKGRRHGGETWRVEALRRDAAKSGPEDAAAAWLRRGEALPGFGHRLYPHGDPRGAELLGLAAVMAPRSAAVARIEALIRAVHGLTGEFPNLDLGLAALAAALGLPEGAPIALFAVGRVVGWLAHALEEYARGMLIRPRARYVGPAPSAVPGAPGVR